jgi:hypothetical protein
MRARQRHLNPRDAGAYAAFDSRFGFALSDGDAVSTWEDRTNGNKDATNTGTARPIYKTAIMGGNPVVRFESSSSDYLKVDTVTASKITLLSALSSTQTGTAQICIQWGGTGTTTNNQFHLWITSSKYACFYRDSTATDIGIQATNNKTSNPTVISTVFDSTARFFENGVAGGTASTSGTMNQSLSQIGIGVKLTAAGAPQDPSYFNGDMGILVIIPSAVDAPLRRRLEQSAGYSFKIACS